MPRPNKAKKVRKHPTYTHFYSQANFQHQLVLSIEEYEVIRLIDYLGYSQEQCSQQMEVARSTIVALYHTARKKMARFLVEGCCLEIMGGNYEFIEEDKGVNLMKIAVTCVDGQVFQHFGHCPSFLVCEVKDGEIVSQEMLDTQGHGCGKLAGFLSEHGVNVVICGGIGAGAKNHIHAAGMEVLPGAHGDALSQVENYIKGTLNYDPHIQCDHHGSDHHCHE